MLDDMDDQYDYDFDGDHYQRGSIYSKRNRDATEASKKVDDDYNNTGVQARDTGRLRSISYA